MATEIAKAYVQIIPTTKGIKSSLESELTDAGSSAGESSGKGFLSGMGGVLKTGAAAVGVAAAAATAAVAKEAVQSYAEYEQLVGGVETLFADNADVVQEYAQNAFKTAGLSANEYMETVTSFSASLLQSVGGDTAAAASIADQAITDMADNANKMGTDMESIQNAYQGFAKQNYTMLDNLKLGYGGTKEEMERLLADAEALSGVEYDISNLSDVYAAIHVVQTELGITGTTAQEASSTISGSVASMKSAWQNLLTGLADENADFGTLVTNFTDSLVTAADNLIPRIGTAMEGIGTLLTTFAETILPKIIDYIVANLPQIIETGITIVVKLVEGLMKAIPQIVAAIPKIVQTIVTTFINYLPELIEIGKQMVNGVWQGIVNAKSTFVANVKSFFSGIVSSVKSLLGIASPSKVFAGIGGFMAEGLSVGFSKEMDSVKNEIGSDVSSIVGTVNSTSVGINASVSGGRSDSFQSSDIDRLIRAISDTTSNVRVYLDSKEIKAGQQRLARAVG